MTNYRETERLNKFKAIVAEKNITWVGGEFVNARTHLDFRCNVCGTEFNKIPDLIRTQKFPCPECSKVQEHLKAIKRTAIKVDEKMDKLGLNKEYEVVEYPEILRDKATFIHKVCGNKIHTSIQNLSRTVRGIKGISTGCEYCSGRHTYTEEEIKEYFAKERPTYSYISNRMSSDHHLMVTVKHNTCGNTMEYQFNYFMRGNGCSECYISAGEDVIKSTLDKIGLKYEYQKTFKDLVSDKGHDLPYDFYLPELNLIIEYDGIQHFVPVRAFGGEDGFQRRTLIDREKDEFSVNNNISIARIPYTIKGINLINLVKSLKNKDNPTEKINKYIINKK